MTMDSGLRGGIGYDAATHRMGADWNKDGSINLSDNAMSMLIVDEHQRTGSEEFVQGPGASNCSTRTRRRLRKRAERGNRLPTRFDLWFAAHPIIEKVFIIACRIAFVACCVVVLVCAYCLIGVIFS